MSPDRSSQPIPLDPLTEHLFASSFPLDHMDIQAVHDKGIRTVIVLTPDDEMDHLPLGKKGYSAALDAHDIRLVQIPIQSHGIPTNEQLEMFTHLMRRHERKNKKALVHCMLGINRTGLLAIAYLVREKGYYYEDAIRHFTARRRLEQGVPSSPIQEAYLKKIEQLPIGPKRIPAEQRSRLYKRSRIVGYLAARHPPAPAKKPWPQIKRLSKGIRAQPPKKIRPPIKPKRNPPRRK